MAKKAKRKTRHNKTGRTNSTSEATHKKNVENFETLIITCQGFGAGYNPSNAAIAITALQTDYTNATNALTDTAAKLASYTHADNSRDTIYIPLQTTTTQVIGALTAAGADKLTLVNAKTIVNKIRGHRKTKKVATTPTTSPTPTTLPTAKEEETLHNISVSQQSFDDLQANFSALIAYVASYSAYNPNEPALKVAALNTQAAAFTTANNTVKTSIAALQTSRATRTKTLYDPTLGLVEIAKQVKAYVKSAFGASSTQFKAVRAIHFKTLVAGKPRKHHKKA